MKNSIKVVAGMTIIIGATSLSSHASSKPEIKNHTYGFNTTDARLLDMGHMNRKIRHPEQPDLQGVERPTSSDSDSEEMKRVMEEYERAMRAKRKDG